MFNKPFVILDLETSGIDPKKNDIIEVAMIRYENGKEVARYDDLIKIDYELPEIITIITGITDADLKEKGKDRTAVFAEVQKVIKGAYIVGHNINFDVSFLREKGIDLDVPGYIDTIPIAQILMPDHASYSLESLTDDLNISHENSHRAMADVEATLDLFKHLWQKGNEVPRNTLTEIQEYLPRGDWDGAVFFQELKGHSAKSQAEVQLSAMGEMEFSTAVRKSLELDEIFGSDGALSRTFDGAESRPQQVEMSQNVLSAFQQGYHLICEAPTGVGKSLAYLAAAAHTAISNKSKVVISTNTINLQQQLYEKDVPLLQKIYREATGHPGVQVALLKGRSHYLCLRRLAEFKRRPRLTETEIILLTKILVWQNFTLSGDSSDIHLTREETLIWDFELSADQKFCTPIKCKPYGNCYLHEARKRAEDADIIIVNHALLCSDLDSEGSLLPDYQYLIVDEAHHFEEVSTKAFGLEIKQESLAIPIKAIKNHLEDLKRRFSGTLFTSSQAFESIDDLIDAVPDLNQSLENFFSIVALFVNRNVPESAFIENLLIDKIIWASEEWLNLGSSLEDLNGRIRVWLSSLRKFAQALELADGDDFPDQSEFLDELLQEIMILSEQMGHVENFFDIQEGSEKLIRWITSDMQGLITIYIAPLMVGPELDEKLYSQKKSVIFTSATLGVGLRDAEDHEQHPFTYIRQMLGLDERFEELILESPYNFETQTYVITPTDLHPVQAKNSMDQVCGFMKELIRAVGGGMLGLFTSHGALERVYLSLMHDFTPKDPKVLAQRISGGRAKVMKAYMNDPLHSVLFGTNSFWEGVDLQGEALTTLVIHKLPFDVPSDPIFKARSEMFANPFMEYSVPRAILRFRQGFGRLIRSQKDYGVLVMLDNRVLTKEYGKMFMEALPNDVLIEKMALAEVPEKVKEWLELSKKS